MESSTPEVSYELALVPLADLAARFERGGLRMSEEALRQRKIPAADTDAFPPPQLTVWEQGAPAAVLDTAAWSGVWPARDDAWWVLDGAEWVAAAVTLALRGTREGGGGTPIPVCVVRGEADAVRAVIAHLHRLKRAPPTPLARLPLRGRAPGGSIGDLAIALSREGFGGMEEALVARCVTAVVGGDPGGSLREQVERPVDKRLYDRSASALRRALIFLQGRARVPHAVLLPYGLYLAVLARFFDQHPSPHPRNQMLLTRWYWRDVLASHEDRGAAMAVRRAQRCVTDDEHGSVQALLRIGRGPRPTHDECWARVRANRKLLAAALSALGPRDVGSGDPIPLAAHFSQPGGRWFMRIKAPGSRSPFEEEATLLHPPAPMKSFVHMLVEATPEVLSTHCVTEEGRRALRAGDAAGFVAMREATLRARVIELTEFLAAWEAPDRPPIASFRVDEAVGRSP